MLHFINNRLLLLLCAMLFSIGSLEAQTVDQIRKSKDYLFGEGRSTTVSRADGLALEQLISQIVVTVGSEMVSESNETGEGAVKSEFTSVITSYSNATLTNTERLIIQNEPDAHVFRYILKSEIDRIFEGREQKVLEMARLAEAGVEEGKIDNALKYYYWSFSLLKSLRYPNDVHFQDCKGVEQRLITWLPAQMNDIFNKISFHKTNDLGNGLVEVMVMHNRKAVASIDYTYFDGADWSNIYSARDGKGVMELRPGVSLSNLQVKCEYHFEAESMMDPEIESVMKLMEPVAFRDAYLAVRSSAVVAEKPKAAEAATSTGSTTSTNETIEKSTLEMIMLEKSKELKMYNIGGSSSDLSFGNVKDATHYTDVVGKITNAIKAKQYASVKDCFTTEGYAMFDKLIRYGNAVVLSAPKYNCVNINNKVVCRSVPLSFAFSNNRRKFVENVSFSFDGDNKIDNICFCLDSQALASIVGMGHWSEASRYLIVSFLENYKTAYALKRWNYLNTIFDDNALIITGHVVKPISRIDNNNINYNNNYTRLTRQDKTQYMRALKRVFSSNEYINLKFASNNIIKFGAGGEIYGIQIKQDYFSTNYADTGYLFLMVDLNDSNRPIIHVRTWQQDKDPEFGIIGAQHF